MGGVRVENQTGDAKTFHLIGRPADDGAPLPDPS
jgi:hypothetical protein